MSSPKLRWGFIASGYLMQGIAAYFDNTRGPILPVIMEELHLDFSRSSWFLSLGYAVAAATTLLTIPWLNRYSERSAALFSCLLGALCGLVAPFVGSFPQLMLLAALLGATISITGAMCNVLVFEGAAGAANQGRILSGLHAVYGLASMSGAQMIAASLRHGVHWHWVYAGTLPVVTALAIFFQMRLKPEPVRMTPRAQRAHLRPIEALVVATFSCYVAGEVMSTMWLTTYLVETRGMDVPRAAGYVSGFFLVMLVTRLLCSIFVREKWERMLLISALGLPLFFFGLGYAGFVWAFPLVGLLGPFFPLLMARIRRAFPESWRTVTLWTLASLQLTLGAMSIGLGSLADHVGVRNAYLVPPLMLAMATCLLLYYFSREPTPS